MGQVQVRKRTGQIIAVAFTLMCALEMRFIGKEAVLLGAGALLVPYGLLCTAQLSSPGHTGLLSAAPSRLS